MKSPVILLFLLFSLSIACVKENSVLVPTQSKPEGPGTSGGGDILDAAFKKTGRRLFSDMEKMDQSFLINLQLDTNELSKLLENATVTGSSKKLYDSKGNERDFINDYVDQSIVGYTKVWNDACQPLKDLIVLHEVIGLKRTKEKPISLDENYVLSQQVVEMHYGENSWGTNCSPKAYVSIMGSKKTIDSKMDNSDPSNFVGEWVGSLELSGVGDDRDRIYDCLKDSSKDHYKDYEFSAYIKIEIKEGKLNITQYFVCDLEIPSEELVIGTIHPVSGNSSQGMHSDNPPLKIEDSNLFIDANKPLLVGYINSQQIEISFGDEFYESFKLNEDKTELEFVSEISYDTLDGSYKKFSRLIPLSSLNKGLQEKAVMQLTQ
ncbi:MAG: hypothetical protein CL674_03050 [Bdellovibrionaceae bacterium]|nr:hypothetical protein [Pseudobdellovibrionaceae bacterium]|tara:strand:+ start:213438 stop:214568 length:1131 start_codon:yes stop_codon:yes gene_type:complete